MTSSAKTRARSFAQAMRRGLGEDVGEDPRKPAYSIDEVLASQVLLHGDRRVADAPRNVLFVSFNVGGVATRSDGRVVPKPGDSIMFTNMLNTERDRLDGLEGHADTPIAVAASSSGAMPGQLGSLEGNVDGTFFNHDPTIAAISLAVRNGWALDNIVAITIGTGLMGADQRMGGAANPFDNTPPFLMNQTTPSPMLDMCLSGTSAETMPRLAKMLLGDRYVNINPTLPCFIPENSTNPQALALLERHGATVNIDEARALILKYWPEALDDARAPVSRSASGTAAPAAPAPAKPAAAASTVTPGQGEFFYVQRYGSDAVLDVSDAADRPGTRVIVYPRKPSGLNQQWQFVPAEGEPGWWYLQTAMKSGMVLTLQDATLPSPRIVIEPMNLVLRRLQLWSLVSTRELGWWFIQSKSQSLKVPTTNPNSFTPTVIGVAEEGATRDAVGVALDYLAFEPMAWGFMRL